MKHERLSLPARRGGLARAASAAVLACSMGCGYLADRGVDFIDQYRVTVGAGTAVGVRGRSLGLVDTGLMMGVKPRAAAVGVKYGDMLTASQADPRVDADQAEIVKTSSLTAMDWSEGSYFSGRNSAALLPAVFTWVDSTPTGYDWQVPEEGDVWQDRHWLWSAEAFRNDRHAQVHAFDLEFEVGLLLYADFGYSPGELVDFLLGIVLIDIAQDDDRL